MHTPFMDKSPRRRDSAGGRLKQRLAQILTRSSCSTNTTSAAPASSAGTAFVSLARAGADSSPRQPEAPPSPYFCTPCTYDRPRADGPIPRRRRTRSASLIHISVDCTGGAAAASGRRSVHSDAPLLQHLSVPARDVRTRGRGKPAARSPSASRRHLSSSSSSWGRARRPRSTTAPYSWSPSSSAASATDDEVAPFSSSDDGEAGGEEAETRTLFSSLSLSSDSSEFYRSSRARKSHRSTTSRRRAPRRALPRRTGEAAPGDAFRPLVSVETRRHRGCDERRKKGDDGVSVKKPTMGAAAAEETAAGAGMAVVKRSSNPYLDFRSSMVEMVVQRRIGSVRRMEELLGSYLSLNSPRHRPAILAAFEDVWEAVFGEE
ncbi:transcription repressor OFP1-like [Panicum miliaceum]|uniref:Transcription repressor n=1 Tax=Panicum miliaceum TaxID=4540 RepID=A0A3L6SRB7_PANMI|nr:transcription repressor OFP1-like [Panicum miliaceum]